MNGQGVTKAEINFVLFVFFAAIFRQKIKFSLESNHAQPF